jgi:hypothetical protein
MGQIKSDFEKCKATTLGCRTLDQMETAVKMNTAFIEKWRSRKAGDLALRGYIAELTNFQKKRIKVIQEYGELLEGSRVITVGNENTPVQSGTIVEFTDFDKEHQHYLPLVQYDGDETIYLCMGIVLPENKKLKDELNAMDYKTRWNAVCRPHATII